MLKTKNGITTRTEPYEAVIMGEAASKANSRMAVTIGGKSRFIKSKKARGYVSDVILQTPVLRPMFHQDVCVEATMYYATRRPDLDESALLDALQGRVYANDRQVKEKHIKWALDPTNPRTELRITPIPEKVLKPGGE